MTAPIPQRSTGLALVTALLLPLALSPARAVAARPNACVATCEQAVRACAQDRKNELTALAAACTGTAGERRACKRAAHTQFRLGKRACARVRRQQCNPCCRSGGTDCAARCGDGVVAPSRGEQCDPPGRSGTCTGGGICGADCRCPPPSCTGGAPCGPAVGACRPGTFTCQGGLLVCVGAVGPTPELCGDGIDQDCDGSDAPCVVVGIEITAPTSLAAVNRSPVAVAGALGAGVTEVACNGTAARVVGSRFSTDVRLHEGQNVVTCVANDATGSVGTASVEVTLDTTPPAILVESPRDGLVTGETAVDVVGAVNDMVTGLVTAADVSVRCNGRAATVANRTFSLAGLALRPGRNEIACVVTDLAGNATASAPVVVRREALLGQRVVRVSGNGQHAPVMAELPHVLVVRLVDGSGHPVASRSVRFHVSRGSGTLRSGTAVDRTVDVTTDAQGEASAFFTLGSRAGTGNHRVTASALGFAGEAEFCARAAAGTPDKILAFMGDNQRGATGKPLPNSLVVLVVDAEGNPLSGVPVEFRVTRGGGTLAGATARTLDTDDDGRAATAFILGPDDGLNNNEGQASVAGAALPATFVATGLVPGPARDTSLTGVVLTNSNLPIPGVTVSVVGTKLRTTTDAAGRFAFTAVPVGTIVVLVHGGTAPGPVAYPAIDFQIVTVAGRENSPMMPIQLPAIDVAGAQVCGGPDTCTLLMAGVPGATLTVLPNSVTFYDGSRVGPMMFSQVHLDKVPMPPPGGTVFAPAWTVQPPGTHFDPPAPVTVPNTAGLPPGAQTDIFQFDHDLGAFVSIGPGTVSGDGSLIRSDPGFGVTKAGWGGSPPPPPPPTNVSGGGGGGGGGGPCGGRPNGSPCNDGKACTMKDRCSGGVCAGVPDNGRACSDGNLCTRGDQCTAGICTGVPVGCSGLDGECTAGRCDASTGTCQRAPRNEGSACTDPNACHMAGTCVAGTCAGVRRPNGTPCDTGDPCIVNGMCTDGSCAGEATSDGTSCDDGDPCTKHDKCTGGFCGGGALDCSTFDRPCGRGVCNGSTGACETEPANAGQTCDDRNSCTTGETCSDGMCGGTPLADGSICGETGGNDCLAGACHDRLCVIAPRPDGSTCEDGDPCTTGDRCAAGACVSGATPNCDDGNACTDDSCNPSDGRCRNVDNITVCDDGNACTTTSVCAGGVCLGLTSAADGTPCPGGHCMGDQCVP